MLMLNALISTSYVPVQIQYEIPKVYIIQRMKQIITITADDRERVSGIPEIFANFADIDLKIERMSPSDYHVLLLFFMYFRFFYLNLHIFSIFYIYYEKIYSQSY